MGAVARLTERVEALEKAVAELRKQQATAKPATKAPAAKKRGG